MFRFSPRDGEFVVDGDTTVVGEPALSELARQVLGAVIDDFELSVHDGHAHFRASKHARPAF
jgi:hypothetical protein